jgi:hypothetical protein
MHDQLRESIAEDSGDIYPVPHVRSTIVECELSEEGDPYFSRHPTITRYPIGESNSTGCIV